jgi:hypothetical protein
MDSSRTCACPVRAFRPSRHVLTSVPSPLDDTPGALRTRNHAAIAKVAAKLTQGMSGGPLLDANDAVAGIIHKGGPEEGRDFDVNIRILEDWLKEG